MGSEAPPAVSIATRRFPRRLFIVLLVSAQRPRRVKRSSRAYPVGSEQLVATRASAATLEPDQAEEQPVTAIKARAEARLLCSSEAPASIRLRAPCGASAQRGLGRRNHHGWGFSEPTG